MAYAPPGPELMNHDSLDSEVSIEPRLGILCRCRSTCSRKSGQGACPCRMDERYCSGSCKCGSGRKPCRNVPESDDSSEEEIEPLVTNEHREPGENHSDDDIQVFLEGLDRARLEDIAAQLLRRSPGAYQDIIMRQDNNTFQNPPQDRETPAWCICGQCTAMENIIERKCCRRRDLCLSQSGMFTEICLNGNILDVAMRANEDTFADEPDRSNGNFRYCAYRQYIYWQHGRMGAGRRVVIPSCCVWKIREAYPSPDGAYKGFQLGDAILVD